MGLLSTGKSLLAALRPPPRVSVELFLSDSRSREVGWGEGRAKDVLLGDASGLSVRVIEGGRQGFASANESSPESARALFDQARAAAALLSPDPHRRMARPSRAAALRLPFDRGLFKTSVTALQKRLAAGEKSLLSSDSRIKKALSLSFQEGWSAQAVLNTHGVAVEDRSTSVSFSLEIMGEASGETHVAWDWSEALTWAALDVDAPMDAARRRLAGAFGAEPLPTGVHPVIFEPRTGAEVLNLVASALSGEAVQKEMSFLGGRKGKAVAAPGVTLVDDGRLPGGPASARYDDEGVPSRRNVLVSKGVLKGFYYDTAAAAKSGVKSTGSAGRPGYAGPPGPSTSNFFLVPGRAPAAKLLAETPRAFVVQDILGMHTADAVSGDFSVGASGCWWEGGRAVRGVKGVTLAGNLTDLLMKIDAVGSDFTWRGSTGCPTFRVSGLSVGGAS